MGSWPTPLLLHSDSHITLSQSQTSLHVFHLLFIYLVGPVQYLHYRQCHRICMLMSHSILASLMDKTLSSLGQQITPNPEGSIHLFSGREPWLQTWGCLLSYLPLQIQLKLNISKHFKIVYRLYFALIMTSNNFLQESGENLLH